ncbi:MAG: sensor histidine kinase [Paracoccaceae bacterium]
MSSTTMTTDMALAGHTLPEQGGRNSGARLKRQLTDYYDISTKLIWQRQAIFFAATMLTAFYFDAAKSLICYAAVLFTELVDLSMARRLKAWKGTDRGKARKLLAWVMANTVLSAGAICLFVTVIALQQGNGGHFTPLFFLFAAALFAAMNNHQLIPALVLRLAIYGATFLFIAFLDIWRFNPPLQSEPWLHVFTVAFVMYFIIDCSFVFLAMYRERMEQMEILNEKHKRALEAYKLKSEFVSTVSHELRTPLTSIKGSLDLINSGALGEMPEAMAPIADIATKNATRLADLINDILDLQKFEAGEMVYNFRPLELCALVSDAVDANRGYAEGLGLTLIADLPESDEVYVSGDEARLMQVMGNIISNALKFSHAGGVVRVGYRTLGHRVRIWVEDKGIGIPEHSQEKVFEQFTQIDGSDQRRAGGTGLGMNISRRIVEQHDGLIDYVSEVGKGTTFFVELDILELPEMEFFDDA